MSPSARRRWFVAIDRKTGETLDVADVRSAPIDDIEHVEVERVHGSDPSSSPLDPASERRKPQALNPEGEGGA